MAAPDERALKRMKALLALAASGVGGEAVAADRQLAAELKKRCMTVADLSDERKTEECYPWKTQQDRSLLLAVLAQVTGKCAIRYRAAPREKVMRVELTQGQHVEAALLYQVHGEKMRKAMENAAIAYVAANRIGWDAADDSADEAVTKPSKLSQEDIEAIRFMAAGITPTTVHKRITN